MEQEIIEGDKLIAEFMGAEVENRGLGESAWLTAPKKKTSNWIPIDALQYHSSWDWLMGVVDKVEDTWISSSRPRLVINKDMIQIVHTVGCHNTDFASKPRYGIGEKRKENVWLAVIEFIKWYNNQKQIT